MLKKSKRITLREVSEMAEVSITTASMYINGKASLYNISEKTCEKLRKIIEENNYVPNFHARAMANGITKLVGVVINNSFNQTTEEILQGIEEQLNSCSYHMIVVFSSDLNDSLNDLKNKDVDGCIVVGFEKVVNSNKIPVVSIGKSGDVYLDDVQAGKVACEYLYGKGHKSIAVLDSIASGILDSLVDAGDQHGISCDAVTGVERFIQHYANYSVVVCSESDVMELYKLAMRECLSIPADFSVIVYMTSSCQFCTCLAPKYKESGIVTAKKLLWLMRNNGEIALTPSAITSEIIEGGSVSIVH